MAVSTQPTERRYLARTRRTPGSSQSNDTHNITSKTVANGVATKKATVPRQPALTTSRVFGQKSPLADSDFNIDIQEFLAKCMSTDQWQKYTVEEKERIVASLPPGRRPQISLDPSQAFDMDQLKYNTFAEPPLTSIFCDEDFYVKSAVARFKRDLKDGYYEKAWQDKAKRAHEERMDGKFDAYLKQHTEEMFIDDDEAEAENEGSAEESEDREYSQGNKKGKTTKARQGEQG